MLKRAHAWACFVAAMTACAPSDPDFDVVLKGGTILDGTGAPRYEADIGIVDGHVARVGDLIDMTAAEEVDVSGLMVAPGFVNLHSHGRLQGLPTAENLLVQGVTTAILNADGGGPIDVSAQLDEAEAGGLAINVGVNVGFNSIWSEINGPDDTRPSAQQLEEMQGLVVAGLQAGAWGVSAGLDYKPAYFASVSEVTRALGDLSPWRTVFTNHDRLRPETGFSSRVGMRETIEIGEATGLMPVITHMKIQGREQGSSDAVLAMMDAATERGVYTAADAYPYLAGQTSLAALIIPGWAQEGGRDAMVGRFAEPDLRARIVAESNEALDARFGGSTGVFLPQTQRELTDVMAEMGASSGGETVVRILEEEGESPSAILRFGSEDDLLAILRHPTTSIACDCDASTGRGSHPRGYGTFPRVLGRYVRDEGVLSWEEAIRKMSGLPAVTIGSVDRGFIAPGMAADLVVFDSAAVLDRSTYADPTARPDGIVHVLVNGRWALRDGVVTGEQGGQVLRRSPDMAARPLSLQGDRSLSFTGGVGNARVAVSIAQEGSAHSARGLIGLTIDQTDLTMTALGLLQIVDGWASITGWAATSTGIERAVTVVVDGLDPRYPGQAGTSVHVMVDGETMVDGRSEAIATVEGGK